MSYIVPSCPSDRNTKLMSRSSINYDFVYNNYTDEGLSQLFEVLSQKNFFKKFEGYYECGDSGTNHIQGYFTYYKKTTKNCILNESGINDGCLKDKISIRPAKNISALVNYVRKDGNLWKKNKDDISDGEYLLSIIGRCTNEHKNLYDEFNIICELIRRCKVLNLRVNKELWGSLYDEKFDAIKECKICKYILSEDWDML